MRKKIYLAKPIIKSAEIRSVKRVLKKGELSQGYEVANFEKMFSKIVGDRECVSVNSGTSALQLALLSLGVGVGDEVLVPSFTFAATANAIKLVGANPIFVDINIKTFNMDHNNLEKLITKKTKALLVVHLFGLPADMIELIKFANKNNLLVIEDAAQSHLASIGNTNVGCFGDAAIFSFYPTKNMTTGEGGMIVFKNNAQTQLARLYRNQGMAVRYQNELVGFNMRLSNIHAAIGTVQLKRLKKWTEKRIENASFLNNFLVNVRTPHCPINFKHVYNQYTILVPSKRESLIKFLETKNIQSNIYYPTPVHRLKPFSSIVDLPQTEFAAKSALSIPVHPKLSKRDLKYIANSINHFYEKNND